MAKVKSYYAVARGKNKSIGVFDNWSECAALVIGFKGAIYQKFDDLEEALEFILDERNIVVYKNELNKVINLKY